MNTPSQDASKIVPKPATPRAIYVAVCVLASVFSIYCAGSILHNILRYGVQVPFWDEWSFIGIFEEFAHGRLSLLDLLLMPQGEHRIGVQVSLSILWWQLTGMNLRLVMVINWALSFAFTLLAASITRKGLGPGSPAPWLVWATTSFFIFNPAAYQLWLWGIAPVYLIVPLLLLAGLHIAQFRVSTDAKLIAAAAAALVASLTFGGGVILWGLFPVAFSQMMDRRDLFKRGVGSLSYLTIGLITAGLYLHLPFHSQAPLPANGSSGPGVLAHFFFAYTGNLVSLSAESPPVLWAEVTGLVLTCFFLALVLLAFREFHRKKEWPVIAIWSCLGFYSLASGVLVTLVRHGFGLAYAVESSRYVLASASLPVAIIALACVLLRAFSLALPFRLHLYSGTLCVTLALLLTCGEFRYLQWSRASDLMVNSYFSQMSGKVAVASANIFPLLQFRNIYPNDDRNAFLRSASFLNSRGWLHPAMWDDAFLQDLASPRRRQEPGYGFVDTFAANDGLLQLGGWAYLADRHERAHAIIVLALESGRARVLSVLFPSLSRGDVFERLHDFEALSSGWKAEIPAASPGTVIRCFAYDALTGQAHLLAGVGSADLAVPLGTANVEVVGSWTRDGYYAAAGRPPMDGIVFGSWSGADSNTGTLRLGPFHLDGRAGIVLPLVTGPQNAGLSVRIRDAATKEILADLTPPPIHLVWWAWQPDLPTGRELTIEIIAEDQGTGWGQWQAVGWPHLLRK